MARDLPHPASTASEWRRRLTPPVKKAWRAFDHAASRKSLVTPGGKCANLSWKLKRLQTLWFDGIGRNNIKPVRERSRDEESVTFGEKTQEEASTG